MIYRINIQYNVYIYIQDDITFEGVPKSEKTRLHVQSDAPGSWIKQSHPVDISTINLSSPYPVGPSPR